MSMNNGDKSVDVDVTTTTTTTTNRIDIENLMKYQIKCFQHCLRNERLLCFDIPEKCPRCASRLDNLTKFLIPPFILPAPLTVTTTNLSNLPAHSLLLQPTNGDYTSLIRSKVISSTTNLSQQAQLIINEIDDLHIGITNSKSEIFDFDSNGLNRNSGKWYHIPSIVIKLNYLFKYDYTYTTRFNSIRSQSLFDCYEDALPINNKWDSLLESYWNEKNYTWSPVMYNEHKFNCLDFIVRFLIDYDENYGLFNTYNKNKTQNICDFKHLISSNLIEPEYIKCFKYLNLLVKIRSEKYFIEPIVVGSHNNNSRNTC